MVVLITGARSGFGKLGAVGLAQAGHTVYAGLRDLSTAGPLEEAAAAAGTSLTPVQLDVTDPAEREAVVAAIEAEHGALGALVNNAGIAIAGPLEELTEDELRKMFEVNFFGLWELTRRVIPAMRAAGTGRIVQISSMAGRAAMPCLGAYAASKHALGGLSQALRHELRPFGVEVGLIEPGPYKTDIFGRNKNLGAETGAPDSPYAAMVERMDRLAERFIDRAGDAQDVADAIVEAVGSTRPLPFRQAMGPGTRVRRLLQWGLPDAGFEAIIRTTLERA